MSELLAREVNLLDRFLAPQLLDLKRVAIEAAGSHTQVVSDALAGIDSMVKAWSSVLEQREGRVDLQALREVLGRLGVEAIARKTVSRGAS